MKTKMKQKELIVQFNIPHHIQDLIILKIYKMVIHQEEFLSEENALKRIGFNAFSDLKENEEMFQKLRRH